MNIKLVVVSSFRLHAPGDLIGDPKEIADILGSEHAHNVVRVSEPEASADAPNASATSRVRAGEANPSDNTTKEG